MTSLFKIFGDMFNPNIDTVSEETHSLTQNRRILHDLLKGDKLTPIDMLVKYGSLRASARIFDLRKDGWNIITKIVKTKNGKHVAQYHLEKHAL